MFSTDDYFKEVIRRPAHEAEEGAALLRHYCNGKKSAMRRYGDGEEVRARELEREIAAAIADSDSMTDDDRAQLLQLQVRVMRHRGLCEAAVALMDAALQFAAVAGKTALAPDDVARLRERCLDTRLPSERGPTDDFVEVGDG